jgi:SNF2 family DNA or RNA helicase
MDLETLRKMTKAPMSKSESLTVECKLRIGKYRKLGRLVYVRNRIEFHFGYWPALNAEIKAMEGHRYHGFETINPRKMWSVADSQRNRFQIAYLQEKDPYSHFDKPLESIKTERPLYEHQLHMLNFIMAIRHGIFACEMGTGKTLVFIEAAERAKKNYDLKDEDIWYIGPRSGVKAVSRELLKWRATVKPEMMTYEGMKKRVKNWPAGKPAPRFICFDECSKLKGPTTQQSQSALYLANSMREEWGYDCHILLMSGTPAPKTPIDWWHQCEVACPGFIKEGTIGKFKARLCIVEMRENLITGGKYPHHVAWLDDDRRCKKCGQFQGAPCHAVINAGNDDYHRFEKSRDEVSYLYKRMHGLVLVKFKKDCLDLPEKQYEIIRVKPTPDIVRAAKLIQARSKRAITALTLTREISDGFQYIEVPSGKEKCPNCKGNKEVEIQVPVEDVDIMAPQKIGEFTTSVVTCDNCGGTGEVTVYKRDTEAVGSPKDQVFIDDLDQHEDVGRYIVWGGFTGTLDRLVGIAHQHGWATLRVDGKGYIGSSATGEKLDSDVLLDAMDRSHPKYKKLREKFPKICFVGHPQAGGMALTLTASPTELFYSNCFNGEARMQAEDRGHRPGMDTNRGLTIKDLIMLPTDKLVLDNLKKKKRLQNLTMGQLADAFTSS